MYKQQSYHTPSEEFFQPSEGFLRDDKAYTSDYFDKILSKHRFLIKEDIEKYSKSKYGKLYNDINKALNQTFKQLTANGATVFKEIDEYINKKDKKKIDKDINLNGLQNIKVNIISGYNTKIKSSLGLDDSDDLLKKLNVCININYQNKNFKTSNEYIEKYLGIEHKKTFTRTDKTIRLDIHKKVVEFYEIFYYNNGTTIGNKNQRDMCIAIPFLEFIKFKNPSIYNMINRTNEDDNKKEIARKIIGPYYIESLDLNLDHVCNKIVKNSKMYKVNKKNKKNNSKPQNNTFCT